MYTASYAADELKRWKAEGIARAVMVRNLAYLCKGWDYVFGAAGELCTVKNRKSYAGNRPDHAESIYKACPVLSGKQPACDGCDWVDTRIFDCRGFTRWLLAMVGVPLFGGTVSAQWEDSKNWVLKGNIQDMPRGLVCCVFRPSHTGMYMGNGSVIHCGGKKGQVVEEELPGSPRWERFGIPAGLYTNAELEAAGVTFYPSKNIPTLRRGSKGDAVETLQAMLNAKYGYNLEIDGNFGSKTEAAVKDFQKKHSLTADGVVGAKTWKALGVTPEQTEQPEAQNTPTLRKGSEGELVKKLQTRLNETTGAGLNVDGKFGAKTESAVIHFQELNNLHADGIVGPKTWTALGILPDAPGADQDIAPAIPLTANPGDQTPTVTIPLVDWNGIKAAVLAAYHIMKKYEGESI